MQDEVAHTECVRSVGVVGGSIIGAVLTGLGWLAVVPDGQGSERDRAVHLWVADREGDRVVGLDRLLVPIVWIDLPAPRHVAALADGGVWIAHSGAGPNDVLVRASKSGSIERSIELTNVLDLDVGAKGDAIVLERRPDATFLVRVAREPAPGEWNRSVIEPAEWMIAADSRVLLGGGRTLSVVELDPVPTLVARRVEFATAGRLAPANAALGGLPGTRRTRWSPRSSDAGPAPSASGWWTLNAAVGDRLVLRSRSLVPRATRSLPTGGACFAVDDGGAVWATDAKRATLHRIAPGERGAAAHDVTRTIEFRLSSPPQAIVIDRDGRPIFALAGAVVRLSRRGEVQRTQGGFDGLVDLSVVPRVP